MARLERQRPIVGLTTYLQPSTSGVWQVPASFLPAHYITGVSAGGGIAVLLPPQPAERDVIARVLETIDALVVTGGRDVDPTSYGQDPHPMTDTPANDRDAWEFALVRGALERGLPLLGICRGAQVLNAVLGGTLHQHLPDVVGHTRHQTAPAVFMTTTVKTVAGTRIAELVGEFHDAQCYHHQAIDVPGKGLIVSARDSEGTIEAVEGDPSIFGDLWVVAVQWHPEQTQDDLRLFDGLVLAARTYSDSERLER